MAMNSTQLKGIKLDKNRSYIINKYVSGIEIHILAGEFNVAVDTLCRRLKKWGIKPRKGDFKKKQRIIKYSKRRFSPEFLANRKRNTEINNDKIQNIRTINNASDHRLVRNILNRAFI